MADRGKDARIGLGAAVEMLMASSEDERAERQLSLLPAALAVDGEDDGAAVARRGPGRPPGSRNKSTELWVEYIQARYRSPLVFLAETFNRPVEALARALHCRREEAFKLQLAAAKELGPYLHQKQPVAVELDARGGMAIEIGVSAEVAAMINRADPGDGAVAIDAEILPPESEENQ